MAQLQPRTLNLTVDQTGDSWVIPPNCIQFSFQARTALDVRFNFDNAFVADSVEDYMTLKSGQAYNSPDGWRSRQGDTITFATDTSSTVIEIIYYEIE